MAQDRIRDQADEASALVSVVIPARNAAATIRRALDSVLAQTYRPLQVIVVDDASTDGTACEVEAYATAKVELARMPKHRGAAAARNEGIARAHGEYVAFLDADDEWLPEKTARQMAVIAGAPDVVFVACAAVHVSRDGREGKRVNAGVTVVAGAQAWKALLAYSYIATPTVLARYTALHEAGAFDVALTVAEDQDLWIRLARLGHLAYVDDVLVRVHDTPESLSKQDILTGIETTLQMVQRHLSLAGAVLSQRERRRILGHRYTSLGRNAYMFGDAPRGASFLLRAALAGNAPAANLWYLLTAAPPVRWLKRSLKRRFASKATFDAT